MSGIGKPNNKMPTPFTGVESTISEKYGSQYVGTVDNIDFDRGLIRIRGLKAGSGIVLKLEDVDNNTATQEQMINISSSGLAPPPVVKLDRGVHTTPRDIRISFSVGMEGFADLNPRIILMRYKRARINTQAGKQEQNVKKWVHPVHLNGTTTTPGANINGGASYDSSGALLPPRNTEWPLASTKPYIGTPCLVDFTAYFIPGGFSQNGVDGRVRGAGVGFGGGAGPFTQVAMFAFALEIDNPSAPTVAEAIAAKVPHRIRGAMSQQIAVKYGTNGVQVSFGEHPMSRRIV